MQRTHQLVEIANMVASTSQNKQKNSCIYCDYECVTTSLFIILAFIALNLCVILVMFQCEVLNLQIHFRGQILQKVCASSNFYFAIQSCGHTGYS